MRVQLKTIIPPVFWPVHQAIRRGAAREVVAKGGRGSGKSSYLSVELVYQLLRHPRCHAIRHTQHRQPFAPSGLDVDTGMEMRRPQFPKISTQKHLPPQGLEQLLPMPN